jgi:hypothetical protein
MTHITSKLIRSSHLVVLSAGVLLQAYSALAREPIGDAQAQARTLLNPPVASHVTGVEVSASTQTSDYIAPRADAQEFARALLSPQQLLEAPGCWRITYQSPGGVATPAQYSTPQSYATNRSRALQSRGAIVVESRLERLPRQGCFAFRRSLAALFD